MPLNWKIFFVALLFALAIGLLGYFSVILFRAFAHDSQAIFSVSIGADIFSFLVSTLLLFAVFYYMGARVDLVLELRSVIISLFLGSLAGHLIWYGSLLLFSATVGNDNPFASQDFLLVNAFWMFWGPFRNAVSEFFVGVTALSIAYIVKKRSPQTDI